MIAIIDYGVGNLQSVSNALKYLGIDANIVCDSKLLSEASHIILPGVGAFGLGIEHLKIAGFDEAINIEIGKGKPFLGICLGMQLLMSESFEMGLNKGLDIIGGQVLEFDRKADKVPQIGWNSISHNGTSPIFENVENNSMVYFVHSFYVKPSDENVIGSITNYAGIDYTSSISSNNIFATQFHPEKSGKIGMEILKSFSQL